MGIETGMGNEYVFNRYLGRVEPVWKTGLVCTADALFGYSAYLRND